MRNDDGYTLTEMLVVIAIIGLIAAALTPAVFGQMNRARAKSAQLQVDTVAAAVEAFRTDVGRYPTASEGLTALIKDSGSEGWTGPYIRSAKTLQDPWGHALVYEAPSSDNGGFHITSLGADGKPGGTGLDQDIKAPSS